jgi:hypothetical protein
MTLNLVKLAEKAAESEHGYIIVPTKEIEQSEKPVFFKRNL